MPKAKLYPWIGDVKGLHEDIEIVMQDEYPGEPFQIFLAGSIHQIADYRYNGPVLVLHTTASFDERNKYSHLRRAAWSYGTDIVRLDAMTIRFFVHPDAEHREPAEITPELIDRLRRLHAQYEKPKDEIVVVDLERDPSKLNGDFTEAVGYASPTRYAVLDPKGIVNK